MTKTAKREGFAARALRARVRAQGRGPTLLEHAIIKAGMIQGGEALWNLGMWTIARAKYGQDPTWEQFAEVAHLTRSPAYRALKGLEDVYGDDLTACADAIDAATAKQLQELQRTGSGRAKDTTGAAGLIGPVFAPPGCSL